LNPHKFRAITSRKRVLMTVTEDTTERSAQAPTSEPSSGPGTTTQAMKDAVQRPTAFDRFADWVSEAMGRPFNIAFWFVLVVAWTLIFALGAQTCRAGAGSRGGSLARVTTSRST
jgi:hypothetical protein